MSGQSSVRLDDLLVFTRRAEVSDLHLTVGVPPVLRIDGQLRAIEGFKPLMPADTRSLAMELLDEKQMAVLDDERELDLSFGRRGAGRYRLNVYSVIEAAAEAGVRLALLQTYYREGGPGRPLEPAQRRFRSESVPAFAEQLDRLTERLRRAGTGSPGASLGVVAHSIRAAPPDDVAALFEEAVRRDLPFHMHVEEQVREIVECAAAYGARPLELLLDRLSLDRPEAARRFTGVHCTHTDPADMARFAGAGGNVCICPTTEANLGDGVADLPGILAAGGSVCLGTDSNARISMLEEARWLELVQRLARERRGVARDETREGGRVATTLLDAATANGARALGVPAGVVRPGAWADLVAFDLGHPELAGWDEETLLESIFLGASDRAIVGTFVGGSWATARPREP